MALQPASFFGTPDSDAQLIDPATALGAAIGTDALMAACAALVLLALVALAGTITARREARLQARIARSRSGTMRELLHTVRMAESIAGIGVWQYDLATGRQQWSDGMRRMFGVEGDEPFVEGDAETLLFANDIDLIRSVARHADAREPYTLQFDVYGYDGVPRSISVHACNLFGEGGRLVRVVAVVRDVTDQVLRERELEHSREEAMSEAAKARALAETDPLTGLANRRRVMSELDRMVMDARMHQMPLTVVVFDIDHFKRVNDTYGHLEGDKVLQRIARIAINTARDSDCVGRIGGEEFVWIVTGASDTRARILTERLRTAVAQGSSTGRVPCVTISLGYTELQPGDTALSIFARADAALYDAKHSGRNQVKVAA